LIELENAVVFHGSNLDVLPTLPDNSVDAIVTDPPYELGFMGKSWDSSGIAYSVELWQECLRVLKPGGHLLAFGGSRTWHRIAVAIEDAGFDVRDSIAWLYGSGFPKSMDVAKAIDKQSGYQGEVIGTETVDVGMQGGSMHAGRETQLATREIKELSDQAKQWQGWGTALKPAFEPIVVARKPLVGTVAANVLLWGVGGLNIDGSRIGTETIVNQPGGIPNGAGNYVGTDKVRDRSGEPTVAQGRWPANIILDEYTAGLLDEQSGNIRLTEGAVGVGKFNFQPGVNTSENKMIQGKVTLGGASRFFYVAKASKKDRNEGLEDLEGKEIGAKGNGLGRTCATCSASVLDGCECADRTFVNPTRQNFHPTVKPTALMEYLVKLVTPPGGTVLDPFTGSGSTGKAALLNGFKFIGIELTADYLPIIEGRLKHAAETYAAKATEEETKEQETLF
jgi:site-specific DNA-methyltransferase (adenine-specific)